MDKQTLDFECSGIDEQGKFRLDNTGYGKDVSPRFVIHNLSPDAKTIAITLEDLDHPKKNFTHWVIWDIPAKYEISAAVPHGKTGCRSLCTRSQVLLLLGQGRIYRSF